MTPSSDEKVPVAHRMQLRLLSNVPNPHARHASASCVLPAAVPYLPPGQARQSVSKALPVSLRYVWIGQEVQEVLDDAGAYVPTGQGVQEPAFARENVPGMQVAHQVDPASEYRPGPHCTHVLFTSYVPALHRMHARTVGAPVRGLYVPGGQGLQSLTDPL